MNTNVSNDFEFKSAISKWYNYTSNILIHICVIYIRNQRGLSVFTDYIFQLFSGMDQLIRANNTAYQCYGIILQDRYNRPIAVEFA